LIKPKNENLKKFWIESPYKPKQATMEQIIEQFQNSEDKDKLALFRNLQKHIFNRLPEAQKYVSYMSEGRWEDYVAEQLKNSSLSERLQELIHNHTSEFWSGEFYDE